VQLFDTETGRAERATRSSPGNASPKGCGEARPRGLAAVHSLVPRAGLAARLRALRESVWAPVLGKAFAVLAGMLALAAIGKASLAQGPGLALEAGPRPEPRVAVAGVTPVSALPPGSAHAAPLDEAPDAGSPEPGKASPGLTADGKVILNRADASELRRLPGIGAKRAEAIVALRQKLGGRFKRVSDLLRVKGIGPKGLKKLEPHVVLDEPKPS
jgi:competence protein ComEA